MGYPRFQHLIPVARELYLSGLSSREVAERLVVSKPWVVENLRDVIRSASEADRLKPIKPLVNKWHYRWRARQVWRHAHGPIPAGYHVHHKDGDFTNNALENLECVEGKAHNSEHSRERGAAGTAAARAAKRQLSSALRNVRR